LLISEKGHPSTLEVYRGQQIKYKNNINQVNQEEKKMIGFAKLTTNPIRFERKIT